MRLFGDCGSDTGIYKEAGLLENGPVVGAHFIFPDDEDIRILKECGGFAVQCPDATDPDGGTLLLSGRNRQHSRQIPEREAIIRGEFALSLSS